jgi:hypothetical protein
LERWDPIGIGNIPECVDEYDDYIPRLAGIFDAAVLPRTWLAT